MTVLWEWAKPRMDVRGWKQGDLAREAGVSPNVIGRFRHGGEVQFSSLVSIARALDSDVVTMLAATGYGPDADAPRIASVREAIAADRGLLPEAKEHIARQYGLLLRVGTADHESEPSAGIDEHPTQLRAVADDQPDEPITDDQDEDAYTP